jgi:hypothetical protein
MKQQLENQARAQRKDISIYTKQFTAHVHVMNFCMVNCMVTHALPMSMQCFFGWNFFAILCFSKKKNLKKTFFFLKKIPFSVLIVLF